MSGRNGTRNRDLEDFKYAGHSSVSECASAETNFPLAFEPWEQWLGMEIGPETLQTCTAAQIVAHCLWEMTFHGFEQSQIQAGRDEIRRHVEELEAMTEEERKERLIPWEQVKKGLWGDKGQD